MPATAATTPPVEVVLRSELAMPVIPNLVVVAFVEVAFVEVIFVNHEVEDANTPLLNHSVGVEVE